MAAKPAQETRTVKKRRQKPTALNVSISDVQTTPLIENIGPNAVGFVAIMANRDVMTEPPRLPWSCKDYNSIAVENAISTRMCVSVPVRPLHTESSKNTVNGVETDYGVAELAVTNRAEARVEDDEAALGETGTDTSCSLADVPVAQLLEVWVKMRLFRF